MWLVIFPLISAFWYQPVHGLLLPSGLHPMPRGPPIAIERPLLRRSSMSRGTMSLTKAALHFDFDHIPYAAGIMHIHSPEHISETHRLGASLFKIDSVEAPKHLADRKTSISFTCSTLFTKDMRVRMFSSQPNESNLYFFKDNRALYSVRFSVIPTKAFLSHRLRLDVTFFASSGPFRATLKGLMPIFLFVSGMGEEDRCRAPVKENANFTEYRRAVLRGKGSDDFWIMAERVLREYSA